MNSRSEMLPKLSVCLLVYLSGLLVQGSTTKSPPPRPPPVLGDPSWALGLRLYKALRSDSSAVNTLFSPLLVGSSIGALGGGSAGTTASQLYDLLKTPSPAKAQPGEILSRALKSVTEANGTSFHLHASSAVFSKQTPPVRQSFEKEIQTKFRLQHKPLGKGDSKADLKLIHSWAKAGLGGQESPALEAEIQTKAGALILANTLRFKGLWEREFSEESTDPRTFLGKKYTKVAMMHRAGLYRFNEDMQNMVQVLEVDLWGGRASMVFLLPFHVESLTRLEKQLTLEQLSQWLEKTTVTSMAISVPKANITGTLSLQEQLSALGLTDPWDQKAADFSGVSDHSKGRLHLGGVLHWASLELAPDAGTGDSVVEEEHIGKPKMFYADHPFIFLVRENTTGALLLMGALDHVEGEAVHDEL